MGVVVLLSFARSLESAILKPNPYFTLKKNLSMTMRWSSLSGKGTPGITVRLFGNKRVEVELIVELVCFRARV